MHGEIQEVNATTSSMAQDISATRENTERYFPVILRLLEEGLRKNDPDHTTVLGARLGTARSGGYAPSRLFENDPAHVTLEASEDDLKV